MFNFFSLPGYFINFTGKRIDFLQKRHKFGHQNFNRMKRYTSLLIAIFTIIGTADALAEKNEEHLFRMLDVESGLPDNNVRNMTMLPDGLMCIQTSSMLSLYDGASCRNYKYNAIDIPYTEYSGLNETCYDPVWNVLWCMTRDHIWIFDLKSRSFEYDLTSRLRNLGVDCTGIQTMRISPDGRLWLCTKDKEIIICDRENNSTETVALPEKMELPVVMKERNGKMWILSLNGVMAEYAPPSDNSVR